MVEQKSLALYCSTAPSPLEKELEDEALFSNVQQLIWKNKKFGFVLQHCPFSFGEGVRG